MASRLTAGEENVWRDLRPGHLDAATAQGWSGTVNELVAGDFLVGPRARVVSAGVTGTNRTLTLERLGVQFNVTYVGASSLKWLRAAP
jgi:hypothetical protein